MDNGPHESIIRQRYAGVEGQGDHVRMSEAISKTSPSFTTHRPNRLPLHRLTLALLS